ncbi:cobalt-precorrin-4/precorrin-4 C(11)-methyltransferase [Nocardioides acrostichi]|uniref:cobalt-precorrin-4/precorrin-4 C(11)-methyltransferase n=1 Tax=Nocardioides acrostichi TaxID=2784339 RepID=UPI002E2E83C6|nr:cobalt-precorrin-4/precorrin-4 C(11)-methyltransferase [Nocardioides acrostichi]
MTVHLVGAGPGAADLLTLRAVDLLTRADLVLYPGTYLDEAVLGHCRASARLVDTQALDLDTMVALMVDADARGERVVRLTSGDPSLYSALHEQGARLDAAGVAWSVVPGVPAYAAAAALVGRELTVPLVAQSVVLTRTQARSTAMPATESLEAFAATGATLVLHLAITRVRELLERLTPTHGPDCPVVVVHRASQPGELVLRGTVGGATCVADAVEAHDLRQAAVVLVGRALADPDTTAGQVAGESYLYSRERRRLRAGEEPPSSTG